MFIRKKIILCVALIWMLPFSSLAIAKKPTHKHPSHHTIQHHKKLSKTHKNKSHSAHHVKKLAHKKTTHHQPNISEDENNNYLTLTQSTPPTGYVSSTMEQKLVDFVYKSVSNVRYSSYKLGGSRFDPSKGIYVVDCSAYVDHTLRYVFPNAYLSLVDSSGTEKPNSLHYYEFFTGLSEDPNEHWSKVEDIEKLQPGDILVFRYQNARGKSTGGHVMVVMNKPIQQDDTYLLSVADSAPVGHSQDTRQPHVSGIGIGSLLLKTNPKTGHAAYAWKIGSRWKNNVRIAMARPLDDVKITPPYNIWSR